MLRLSHKDDTPFSSIILNLYNSTVWFDARIGNKKRLSQIFIDLTQGLIDLFFGDTASVPELKIRVFFLKSFHDCLSNISNFEIMSLCEFAENSDNALGLLVLVC